MKLFQKSKKKTDCKLETVMVYAKITDLNTTYMIYNAVKNKRYWRDKKMDCDKEELKATQEQRKERCEYCKCEEKKNSKKHCKICGKRVE